MAQLDLGVVCHLVVVFALYLNCWCIMEDDALSNYICVPSCVCKSYVGECIASRLACVA